MYESEYIRVCDHVYHNVMYWLSLSLSVSVEYVILLHNHTNVVPSSSSSVHSILILMHPHPQCFAMLNNSTLPSRTGMWVGWLICQPVSTFVYVIMCITHVHIYTIMLCIDSLSLSLSTEYDILLCNHTNVVLSSSSSAYSILILMHPHPQCFRALNNSTLPSGTGMWVGWLICMGVSTFVYMIMCIIHVPCDTCTP